MYGGGNPRGHGIYRAAVDEGPGRMVHAFGAFVFDHEGEFSGEGSSVAFGS